MLIEFIFDYLFRGMGVDRRVVRIVIYFVVGAVAGAVSLLLPGEHIIRSDLLRYVALVIVPLVLGMTMHRVGRRRNDRQGDEFGLESFWPSWGFAFCFGLVHSCLPIDDDIPGMARGRVGRKEWSGRRRAGRPRTRESDSLRGPAVRSPQPCRHLSCARQRPLERLNREAIIRP